MFENMNQQMKNRYHVFLRPWGVYYCEDLVTKKQDTIFRLDGKPMTHTPGTEDEYGSCWGFEHLYSYLYSGYLQMEKGDNRMYRWYVANPVRFQESLKVEIQNQR
jgi:hypothetical protein